MAALSYGGPYLWQPLAMGGMNRTRYTQIRKDTIEAALDIVNCSKKAYLTENLEVLLISPSIDGVSKADNNIIKYLLFEFLTNTKRSL